jgi:uncharacterized protein
VIAIDTGLFVALADRSDRWHASAVKALSTIADSWITTWPVLTEATHLLRRRLDMQAAIDLMQDAADGGLQVWSPSAQEMARLPSLLRKYAALPMDLADASLVLLAEHLGHGRILSTDERDFKTYRWKRRKPFDNLLEAPT